MSAPSYTIREFCVAERISRSMFYKLDRAGKGPRRMRPQNTISEQARIDWHRAREAEALEQREPQP